MLPTAQCSEYCYFAIYYKYIFIIFEGNLTCDTIFIQHNGLVKIGSVAPDAIHKNVKTFRENSKNFHILAPECAGW